VQIAFDDPNSKWQFANTRAQALLGVMFDRMGFDDRKRAEAIAIGIYAELAFKLWLDDLGIPYAYGGDDQAAEGADQYDFLIGGRTFDIKCAKTEREVASHWEYGYPVDQNPQHKDFVVVANFNPRTMIVLFYGYIHGAHIASFPKKSDNKAGVAYSTLNYNFPYTALDRDILSLLRSL